MAPAPQPVPAPAGGARPRPGSRPLVVAVVCALIVVEALVAAGLAVAWVVDLFHGAQVPGAVVFLALCAAGVAVVLVAAARALWAGRRWARSPVMTWQVLLVVLSVSWLGVETSLWGVLVLVVAVVVGIGLLVPPAVAWTVAPADSRAPGGAGPGA